MKRRIILIAALAVAFAAGWLLGGRAVRQGITETVRIDMVYYERPQPVSVSDKVATVDVPKFIFARDTVMLQADAGNVASNVASDVASNVASNVAGFSDLKVDSIPMQVTLRTLEYRDSSYYARVVGPVVGTLAPRLDHIETYNRTVVRTVTERRRMMLSVGVGTEYSSAGWMPSAELDFTVDMRFVMLSATVRADNITGTPQPRIGLKAALPLWSR